MVEAYFQNRKKKISIVQGGSSRPETVLNGINFVKPKKKDILIIHNGANPLVTYDELKNSIKTVKKSGACIVCHDIKDTLKEIKKKKVLKTHNREQFIKAQTPQSFVFETLEKSLKKAGAKYLDMTDEASLVESAGFQVSHIPASEHNFKITTHSDYERMRHILGDFPRDYVVGIGQDSHMFSDKKGLVLGGLKFAGEYKLKGNSDGDVMLHSLCNAILQAIGDKSLGAFADKMCLKENIKDSGKYLKKTMGKMRRKGYGLNNIGFMIEGGKPNIDKISPRLKKSISALTALDENRIGITATSGEKLTSFGKGKGLQVFSIVSLKKL